jgi:hypothetical protein
MIAKDSSPRIVRWDNIEPVSAHDQAAVLAAFEAFETDQQRWTTRICGISRNARWLFELARGATIAEASDRSCVKARDIVFDLERMARSTHRAVTIEDLRREGSQRSDEALWLYVTELARAPYPGEPFAAVVKRPNGEAEVLGRFDAWADAVRMCNDWEAFNGTGGRKRQAQVRFGYPEAEGGVS